MFSLSLSVDTSWLESRPFGEAQDDLAVVAKNAGPTPIDVLSNDRDTGKWGSPIYYHRTFPISDIQITNTITAPPQLSVTQPQHGTVSIDPNGEITYTPTDDFLGIDTFSYQYQTDDGETTSASVYINVVDPLLAVPDWRRVDEGSSNNVIDVLGNDTLNAVHPSDRLWEGGQTTTGTLDIVSVTQGSKGGVVEITADKQNAIFTPDPNAKGLETFRYTIEDKQGNQSEAFVQIQITTLDDSQPNPIWQEQIASDLRQQSLDHFHHQFGQPSRDHGFYPHRVDSWMPPVMFNWQARASVFAPVTIGGNTAAQISTSDQTLTIEAGNDQDAGIVEGNLVRTDGNYLYSIASHAKSDSNTGDANSYSVQISDIRDPSSMTIVGSYVSDSPIIEMHLLDERLTVISQDSNVIRLSVLDVSDPTQPSLVYQSELNGRFGESRLIGDRLYLIAESANSHDSQLEETCYAEDAGCFYETASQYIVRIMGIIDASLDSGITTTNADGSVTQQERDSLISLNDDSSRSFTRMMTLASFDVSPQGQGPIDIESFAASTHASEIYVSADAIYILDNTYHQGKDTSQSTRMDNLVFRDSLGRYTHDITTINKVSFDDLGEMRWAAAGNVPGHLLNSFSVSQHDGYLRVATTDRADSQLSVLQQDGLSLEIVGQLDHLGVNERLYSARFEGDVGFMVTFRKVDPLFVLDLSDPTDPKLAGELRIPGYSNYLHVIDENHLLGIGRGADENTGLFEEMQISIFDISNMSDPKLKHRYSFEGGRQLWSPLMQDAWNLGTHQSISFFDDGQILAMPIYSGSERNWAWQSGTSVQDVTTRVFEIDVENGITVRSDLDFPTSFDPSLARSLRVNETLFSISPTSVQAYSFADLDQELGRLTLDSAMSNDPTEDTSSSEENVSSNNSEAKMTGRELPNENVNPGGSNAEESDLSSQSNANSTAIAAAANSAEVRWHNESDSMDVNGDGQVQTRDLLILINFLGKHGTRTVIDLDTNATIASIDLLHPDHAFVDVNADGKITAQDALKLVNHFSSLAALQNAGASSEQVALAPQLGQPVSFQSTLRSTDNESSDAAIRELF